MTSLAVQSLTQRTGGHSDLMSFPPRASFSSKAKLRSPSRTRPFIWRWLSESVPHLSCKTLSWLWPELVCKHVPHLGPNLMLWSTKIYVSNHLIVPTTWSLLHYLPLIRASPRWTPSWKKRSEKQHGCPSEAENNPRLVQSRTLTPGSVPSWPCLDSVGHSLLCTLFMAGFLTKSRQLRANGT